MSEGEEEGSTGIGSGMKAREKGRKGETSAY